jgi:hypothetical protein
MLSVMPRLAKQQKYRLRQIATTALFALVSSPSAASFSSSHGIITSSTSSWGIASRGGSLAPSRFMTTTTTTTTESSELASTATDTMTPAAKLEALRAKMKELNLDVFIVPSDDPHLSGKCSCLCQDVNCFRANLTSPFSLSFFRICSRSLHAPCISNWIWRKRWNCSCHTGRSSVVD